MAFLDNSGDIILDAVLTDTGRFRMARGDFRITKFALGDDEIDYALYNKNHPSGSAYYDLEVLKTPILEAFTNNTSNMKSKLMTISRTNILYMPVIKLHNGGLDGEAGVGTSGVDSNLTKLNSKLSTYVITVDENTEDTTDSFLSQDISGKGIIRGSSVENLSLGDGAIITLELGLNSNQLAPSLSYPSDLQETQFIMEMDSRLGSITTPNGASLSVSYIDDDQVASYFVGSGGGSGLIRSALDNKTSVAQAGQQKTQHRIRGPRDKVIMFKVLPHAQLANSDFLFTKLGSTLTTTNATSAESAEIAGIRGGTTFYYIDTLVKITAATVGVSMDIPIRFIKKKDS